MPLLEGTPLPILLGAMAPAALWVVLVCWLQRGEARPGFLLAGCVLWGAVAAPLLSASLNDVARAWLAAIFGPASARELTATTVAPVIEEIAKAFGLLIIVLVRPTWIRSARDGVVYGALIGVGFVLAENVTYLGFAVLQGGDAGLVRAVYLRGILGGANHPIFTATIGAGIGLARVASSTRGRVVAPVLGCLAAVGQHLAWNAAASPTIVRTLCAAAVAGGACRPTPAAVDLFAVVPLVVMLFLGPGAIGVLLAATRGHVATPSGRV